MATKSKSPPARASPRSWLKTSCCKPAARLLSIHPFGGLRVDALGIYPTVETMAAQLLLTVLLVASAFWPSAAAPAKAQMAAK